MPFNISSVIILRSLGNNMDCNLKKTVPGSPSQLLYQQVIDQSEVCDVTVKVGHWVSK